MADARGGGGAVPGSEGAAGIGRPAGLCGPTELRARARLGVLCANVVASQEAHIEELRRLRAELVEFIDDRNCGPILIRLAWHDSGTYDQRIKEWPARGGANGGNWFQEQLEFGANAGLDKARNFLKPFEKKYPLVSRADLIQMASAVAIEKLGGPKIDMIYGRRAIESGASCVKPLSREGFAANAGLPDGGPPFSCGSATPEEHLRNVFGKKMGFNDQEIVALSGAHTIGRVFKERSGACPFGYGNANASKYTKEDVIARHDGAKGIGMAGGAAWTKNWLSFDNAYFTQPKDASGNLLDKDLVWLPTDACVFTDPAFKQVADAYAKDEALFMSDYAKAHKKLSELGAEFSPPGGIKI